MPATALIRRTCFALVLAAINGAVSLAAFAQPQNAPSAFEPRSGQEGKDVVWVPTPQAVVDRMLDMAKVTPGDFVMDLGSGDGRTVITAAKRGARALGIEYNPDMVELSKRAAEKEGVSGKASFVKADLYETDFSKASVITMFLLPDINLKLRPKILALKTGTRIVSNTFTMGEWQADESATVSADAGCSSSWCTALLWIVPARVAGTHRLAQGELVLKQEFQVLSGTITIEGKAHALEGKVRGEEVTFTAGGREYRGRMNGKRLELR
ncbi:MAG: class I SAM-dependent methyltransferase [Betaproteobacteria bacterium]|nr:class I SAM-dependent methyltransferase [Betaproteobacteria bacterium]